MIFHVKYVKNKKANHKIVKKRLTLSVGAEKKSEKVPLTNFHVVNVHFCHKFHFSG